MITLHMLLPHLNKMGNGINVYVSQSVVIALKCSKQQLHLLRISRLITSACKAQHVFHTIQTRGFVAHPFSGRDRAFGKRQSAGCLMRYLQSLP